MRNFYNSCLCLIILLFFCNSIFGQKNFMPGYVVTNNFDSIYGLINYGSNSKNSKECEFKVKGKADIKFYYPFDINSYVLDNNRRYISKNIEINGEVKQVFLEYLVNGIIDLYYYNEGFEEFFYIEKDGELFQLDNNAIEMADENGVKHIRYSNQYKGVLKKLFGETTELDEKIINSKFQFASLVNLTKEYHNIVCNDEICIDYTKSRKFDIFCEILAGKDLSYMGLASSKDYIEYLTPMLGINLHFKDNRYNSKINLVTGVNLLKQSYSGGYRNTIIDTYRSLSHGVNIDFILLQLPVTLEYNLLPGRIKPTISISVAHNVLLNADYYVELRNYTNQDEFLPYEIESPLRRSEFSLMTGLGCNYELNNNSIFYFSIRGSYRAPYSNLNYILDRLYFKSAIFTIGYGFRVK